MISFMEMLELLSSYGFSPYENLEREVIDIEGADFSVDIDDSSFWSRFGKREFYRLSEVLSFLNN